MTGKQLTLFAKTKAGRQKRCYLAARMIAVLAVSRRWMTRAEFAERGFSKDGRECRAARAAAHGRIIRGQKGYKLMRYATVDEIRASSNAWMSQIISEQRQHRLETKRAHEALRMRGLL